MLYKPPSFALPMPGPSTSAPVLTIDSRVISPGLNPLFSTVKMLQGLFLSFAGLRLTGTGLLPPNTRFALPPAMVTNNCAGPLCTVTLKEQEALLPPASEVTQATVVIPAGKTEPVGGVQTVVTP